VIVAPSFADIFFGNCCQNGLLPVALQESQVQELFRRTAAARGGYDLTIDLVEGSVSDGQGFEAGFVMDEYRREMLLQGLDEIGKTLRNEPAIAAFESRRTVAAGGVSA
jgi:3-isopropylmalate/(R)-2-methylmalate dehydratase small subunit